MQRKRIVNSLLIVVGVAFGLSSSVGKVSAAEISVGDVVPVTIVDQILPDNEISHDSVEADDELLEDEEMLNDEYFADDELLDEVDVEIGEAIAVERSEEGLVTSVDLLAPDMGAQDDKDRTGIAVTKLGNEPVVSTSTSLPAHVAASGSSVNTGNELVDTENLSPIVQKRVSSDNNGGSWWPLVIVLVLVVIGLLSRWNNLRLNGLQG